MTKIIPEIRIEPTASAQLDNDRRWTVASIEDETYIYCVKNWKGLFKIN